MLSATGTGSPQRDGFLNFAGNVGGPFSFPNGSDNDVTATGNLSAALNSQTFLGEPCTVSQCGNTVTATGPLSLVVAAGVVRKLVEGGVGATSSGANRFITLANSFNSDNFGDNPNLPPANVLAARHAGKPFTLHRNAMRRCGGTQVQPGPAAAASGVADEGQQPASSSSRQEVECRRPRKPSAASGRRSKTVEPKSDSQHD